MSTVEPRSAPALTQASPQTEPKPTSPVEEAPKLSLGKNVPRTEPLPVSPSRMLAEKVSRSLWRRRLLAVTLGLLGAWLAAFELWRFYPVESAAEVWLQLPQGRNLANGVGEKEETSTTAQLSLLKSPLIQEAVLSDPEIVLLLQKEPPAQPLAWLHQHIQADAPGAGIVRITATSYRAGQPKLLAEAVARAFIEEMDGRHRNALEEAREAYQQVQKDLQTPALPEPVKVVADPRLPQLENERRQLQQEQQAAQLELQKLITEQKIPPALSRTEIEAAGQSDRIVQECTEEIERLTRLIHTYERVSARGLDDPAVRPLQMQLEACRLKLMRRRLELAPALEQSMASQSEAERRQQRDVVEMKLAAVENKFKQVEAAWQTLTGAQREQPNQPAPRAENEALQEVARRLAVEVRTLEAEAETGSCITQLGGTRVNSDTKPGLRIGVAAGGAALTFLLLALSVGLIELGNPRIKTAGDLGQCAELSLIGTLPDLKTLPIAHESAATGRLAEAVDVLRTLLIRRTGGNPCILLVTSANAGEGKSTLACHLAASLARAWRKTLLVDGNLRSPTAHKCFNLAQDPGLSDILRGEADAADVIQPTALNRLWLMPAGRAESHALQALAQQEAVAFLEPLREQYEFIIVDSSAVLPVADTLLLSQHVDFVVLAVRCGKSLLSSVRAAQQRLLTMGAPFFGVVVLGASTTECGGKS